MFILVSLSLHQHWHILHRTDKEDVTVGGGTETVTSNYHALIIHKEILHTDHIYVNKVTCTVYMYVSLVPRLPHSRMRTLKLCRRGEPGIFSHVSSVKGREGSRDLNCAWAYPRLRTGKSEGGGELTTVDFAVKNNFAVETNREN